MERTRCASHLKIQLFGYAESTLKNKQKRICVQKIFRGIGNIVVNKKTVPLKFGEDNE